LVGLFKGCYWLVGFNVIISCILKVVIVYKLLLVGFKVAVRASRLEAENVQLKAELEMMKTQSARLYRLLVDKGDDFKS